MGANVKEFLDLFRVSSVALCNGWKIDTIFIKIDNSNFHLVPRRSEIRNYLDEHYGYLVQVLCDRARSDEETLIFTYPYQE